MRSLSYVSRATAAISAGAPVFELHDWLAICLDSFLLLRCDALKFENTWVVWFLPGGPTLYVIILRD